MTDEDIIRALGCCVNGKCFKCPLKTMNCSAKVPMAFALDLISRQQAELEKCIRKSTVHEKTVELVKAQLKTANEVVDKIEAENNSLRAKVKELQALLYIFLDTKNGDLVRITNTELENIKRPIKTDAIKEFAEKLKSKVETTISVDRDFIAYSFGDEFKTFSTVDEVIEFLTPIVIKEMAGER